MDRLAPLNSILQTAGITADSATLTLTGHDPVLRSPFRIGEAGAAVLAAVGQAASNLWQLKTGQQQAVSINAREAAIAQRSHLYLKRLEGNTPELWSPFSTFYQTQDQRWVQFHCNFPAHQQGVLDFFHCPADLAALTHAVQQQSGAAIEQALSDRGLCAALLRTPSEWQNHPQAEAIAALPLFDITQIGDSAPEPLADSATLLSGIRVLDLSRVLAGPVCSKTLAQLDADVLRIASPHLPFILPLVMDTGFGKRNAHLDLDVPAQKAQLFELARTADVFLQAYRPGALAERGFSPTALAKLRPGIIVVDLSAYSHQGPWAHKHGYDSLVQTATGIAFEQTAGQAKPQHLPAQSLDYLTGYLATFAILEALRRRATDGGSYWIRLSLAQTGHWFSQLPRVTGYEACQNPTAADIPELLATVNTSFGPLQHLKPLLHLAATPLQDRTPPEPLGAHQAEWKAR